MKPRLNVCLLPLFVLFAVGCSQNGSQETASSDPPVSTAGDENASVVPEDTKPSEPDIQNVSAEAVASDEQAPEQYLVKFETAKGNFVLEITRRWAPLGADRFHQLVKGGFYDDCAFFRVVPNFVVQFGINGDPARQAKWRDARIPDDEVMRTNKKGMIVFATSGANSRTSQVFINLKDNFFLGRMGFAPFGRVVEGMDVVNALERKYGEEPSKDQGRIQERGNEFLKEKYPDLDYVKTARIVSDKPAAESENP